MRVRMNQDNGKERRMDPDATLERIEDAVVSQNLADSDEACRDLFDWLTKDGFEPQWKLHPLATRRYRQTAERLDFGALLAWS